MASSAPRMGQQDSGNTMTTKTCMRDERLGCYGDSKLLCAAAHSCHRPGNHCRTVQMDPGIAGKIEPYVCIRIGSDDAALPGLQLWGKSQYRHPGSGRLTWHLAGRTVRVLSLNTEGRLSTRIDGCGHGSLQEPSPLSLTS